MNWLAIATRLDERNMSAQDRSVRALVGGCLVAVAIAAPAWWAWIGLYPLITGILGRSPLHALLDSQRHHNLGA